MASEVESPRWENVDDPVARRAAIANWIESTPTSREAASAERDELNSDKKWIEVQLSDPRRDHRTREEHEVWRHKAKTAMRIKEQRATFLKRWLADNWTGPDGGRSAKRPALDPLAGEPTLTHTARRLASRVGQAESVCRAVFAWLDDPTDNALAEVRAQALSARPHLDSDWVEVG